jgi:hypothetical protein
VFGVAKWGLLGCSCGRKDDVVALSDVKERLRKDKLSEANWGQKWTGIMKGLPAKHGL